MSRSPHVPLGLPACPRGCVVRAQHGQRRCGGGRDRYVPVPTARGCPPPPLAQPGVPAAPRSRAAGGSSLRALLRGCPGGPRGPSRVRVQVQGKPRHRRRAAAPAGAAPLCKGEVSQGGGRGHGPRGAASRAGPAGQSYGRGGAQGHAAPGRSGSPGWAAGRGHVRGSSPGVRQPQERRVAGAAPCPAAAEGRGRGLYRGAAGSPPSRRCVSPKARSSCSSWELSGRWISRCMRSVSSHCSSLAKDGLSKGDTWQLRRLCPHPVPCPRDPWGSPPPTASRGPGRSSRRRWGRSWGGRRGGSSVPGSPGR